MPNDDTVWRLDFAIQEALGRQWLAGRQLSRIVGHVAAISLIKRELLCVLSACYAFMGRHDTSAAKAWPSVKRELRWMQALLPLARHDLRAPLSSRVLATDASEGGKGACQCRLGPDHVAEYARYKDKWRFKVDPSALRDLRTNALEQVIKPFWDSEEGDTADPSSPEPDSGGVPDIPFSREEVSWEPSFFGGTRRSLHFQFWI